MSFFGIFRNHIFMLKMLLKEHTIETNCFVDNFREGKSECVCVCVDVSKKNKKQKKTLLSNYTRLDNMLNQVVKLPTEA